MSEPVDKLVCDTKHQAIDRTFVRLEKTIDKVNTKLFWVFTLLTGNLAAVILVLLQRK